MKKLFRHFSFRTQLSFLIISFVLTFSTCSFIYLKWLQDNFTEVALQSQAEVISKLIAEDMAQLIYLSDPDLIASITFKLKNIDHIASAVFYDKSKQPLLKINNFNDEISEHEIFNLETDVYYDGLFLGYAKLNLHSHQLQLEKNDTNNVYALFLLVFILVGIILVYVFDRQFIARLTELSTALKHVAEKQDFSTRLYDDKDDDIGFAKLYFNQLVGLVENQTANLVYQANHDNLTGLYNRNRIITRLDFMLENRPKSGFHAICYLDLDQFKVVNDTCGHAVGDNLLKKLSSKFLDCIKNDKQVTFGRLGGDEFILLLENKSKGEIHAEIHKFQVAVQDFKFQFLEREFQIGMSLGCIIFSHEDTNSSELFSAADSLCYQVKNTNRGDALVRYLYDEQLVDFQLQMDWVARINKAISDDKFQIYLQPIVKMLEEDHDWDHFEVLIRLNENNDIIAPSYFIPVAERYGLTKKLDRWVIESVFKQMASHSSFVESVKLVSINLSVLSIVDRQFREHVKSLFHRYAIPFNKICFEITETGVISDIGKAIDFINEFRTLGVAFSLDDFGSGMSSFGYLKDLNVDYLKIDGQFVKNVCHDPVMKEMVAAMINIGHISNKKIVAEQVEDQKTVKLISEMGADFIQGYYYSKPLPIAEFINKK